MSTARIALSCLLAAMTSIMIGCIANAPFRTNFDPTGGDRTKAVLESTSDYKLGFVEFDDQGYFWDIRQRTLVEQMVRDEAGLGNQAGATPRGIILVAFVHGWKDNASYDGDGVRAFRDILEQLSNAEKAQTDHPARPVVGVYAGWRGLSATWEPFKELSFWNRKDTAHKVGGYGALTKLFVDLENIQRDSLAKLPAAQPRTELIIIGHSFGGAAVYSALSQIITERFVDTIERHGRRLKPLGDQVILLNPAFEALRHYDLNQLALAVEQYPVDQRPVLSIFTSKGDWATHYAFPIGRFFSTLLQTSRDEQQRRAGLQTVGWFRPFVTHELDYVATSRSPATQPTTLNAATKQHEYHHPGGEGLRRSVENVRTQRGKWRPNAPRPQTYDFDDCVLRPLDGFHPGDPFLIVSTDRRIMKDHSDITNKVLINFLREYIQFCQVDALDHSQ